LGERGAVGYYIPTREGERGECGTCGPEVRVSEERAKVTANITRTLGLFM
jgi:hypothetical protein